MVRCVKAEKVSIPVPDRVRCLSGAVIDQNFPSVNRSLKNRSGTTSSKHLPSPVKDTYKDFD